MFRFLAQLLVALFVLFFARIFFATARRLAGRSGESSRQAPQRDRTVGGKPARRPETPRIDRSTAEDVPFVEVGAERSERSDRS